MKIRQRDGTCKILFFTSVFLCWLFVMQYGIFGSDIDWISQHSVLPDYFRQRFYDTGDLFPDMAWNLGGGQNIYHFSYYGLFSPVILLSYMLPFIRMDHYIIMTSIFSYSCSAVLFYQWTDSKKLSKEIHRAAAFLFLLASPLLYHSYNQLMFVNYMPFLCLALSGVDKYSEKREKGIFILGVCGMILTSFYFSIGGMAALAIYSISKFVQDTEQGQIKEFFRKESALLGYLLLCVCLCGILLVPTAYTLFSRGQGHAEGMEYLFLPSFEPVRFLYSPYGLGLSAFALIALLGNLLFAENRKRRIVPVGLLLIFMVPVFGYILNGGLYAKDKVFIPFLPLVCLETAYYMQRLKRAAWIRNKKRILLHVLPYLAVMVLFWWERGKPFFEKYWYLAIMDSAVMLLLYLLYLKWGKFPLPLWGACVILFLAGWGINKQAQRMIPREKYEDIEDAETVSLMKKVLDADTDWYRMEELGGGARELADINRIRDMRQNVSSLYSSAYNSGYDGFRKNTFELNQHFRNGMMQAVSDNPLFLRFMGVRYITGKKAPAGCSLYREGKESNLYRNEEAAPVAYITNKTMSQKDYEKLDFPQNQTALLQKAVVSGESREESFLKSMRRISFALPKTKIHGEKEEKLSVSLKDRKKSDDLLAVKFQVKNNNPNGDVYIRLEGQTNRLTAENHEYANGNNSFSFTVTLDGKQESVELVLGKGDYEIYDLEAYTGRLECLSDGTLYENSLKIKESQVQGDCIETFYTTTGDGYLITSIPYDKGFQILVDGKAVKTEKVNTEFLGARVPAGKHSLIIQYEAPGKRLGTGASIFGIVILSLISLSTYTKSNPGKDFDYVFVLRNSAYSRSSFFCNFLLSKKTDHL